MTTITPIPACFHCAYWQVSLPSVPSQGECRERSPGEFDGYKGLQTPRWPTTLPNDWCASYQSMETRITMYRGIYVPRGAQWAAFFDQCGWEWEVRPESDGPCPKCQTHRADCDCWVPDFRIGLPNHPQLYVDVVDQNDDWRRERRREARREMRLPPAPVLVLYGDPTQFTNRGGIGYFLRGAGDIDAHYTLPTNSTLPQIEEVESNQKATVPADFNVKWIAAGNVLRREYAGSVKRRR